MTRPLDWSDPNESSVLTWIRTCNTNKQLIFTASPKRQRGVSGTVPADSSVDSVCQARDDFAPKIQLKSFHCQCGIVS